MGAFSTPAAAALLRPIQVEDPFQAAYQRQAEQQNLASQQTQQREAEARTAVYQQQIEDAQRQAAQQQQALQYQQSIGNIMRDMYGNATTQTAPQQAAPAQVAPAQQPQAQLPQPYQPAAMAPGMSAYTAAPADRVGPLPQAAAPAPVTQQPAGWDANVFMSRAMQAGIPAPVAMAHVKAMNAIQAEADTHDKDTLENHIKQGNIVAGEVQPLLDMSDTDFASNAPQALQHMQDKHEINSQDLAVLGIDPANPTKAGLQSLQNYVLGYTGQMKTRMDQQDILQKQAQTRAENAEAQVKEQAAQQTSQLQANPGRALSVFDSMSGLNPQSVADYKQQAWTLLQQGDRKGYDEIVQKASAENSNLSKELDPRLFRQKLMLTKAEAAARQQAEGTLTADGEKIAAQIANYQQAPLGAFAMRTPQGQAIMARVGDMNKDYHAEYFPVFQATEKDSVTGKLGTSSRALNTMIGHLGVLNQAVDGLDNGNVQVLNRLANSVGAQTGSDARTVYEAIVHRIGPEVTKAYVAGGGTAEERGTNEKDFSSSLSPKQIRSNIGISAQLADSLIRANQETYNRGTYGRGQQKLISDEAEAARNQLVGLAPKNLQPKAGGGTVNMRAPNGQTKQVPADQVEHYKSLGAKVVQ